MFKIRLKIYEKPRGELIGVGLWFRVHNGIPRKLTNIDYQDHVQCNHCYKDDNNEIWSTNYLNKRFKDGAFQYLGFNYKKESNS